MLFCIIFNSQIHQKQYFYNNSSESDNKYLNKTVVVYGEVSEVEGNTITINEQAFIKSIIKNPDGTHEFVLSLSAKVINNDENFFVESHWNLDKYENDVTFYNFQIWANTIDDLYLLGEEVLNLLNIEKPISEYDNSEPPVVFVRKGKYGNGGLDLQIINNNGTQTVNFDAGYRATETSEFNNLNTDINLNGQYLTNVRIETGRLFDIGFRIGDGVTTPDDLFMSDGPWGYDDSQAGTTVNTYEVTSNDYTFADEDRPVERNVYLDATTNTYVAAYRALTPRFEPVDLTDFNNLKFTAKGTGQLEIAFVKASITDWEDQYKRTVMLSETPQTYLLPIEEFYSATGNGTLNDVVTLVFTMVSQDGTSVNKTMTLENLRFSNNNALSVNDFVTDTTDMRVYPNPMQTTATIDFTLPQAETVAFELYDQTGKQVYSTNYSAVAGKNSITFNRNNLSTGLYFCKIVSDQYKLNPLKLIIK